MKETILCRNLYVPKYQYFGFFLMDNFSMKEKQRRNGFHQLKIIVTDSRLTAKVRKGIQRY
jgi:hypothetical protein